MDLCIICGRPVPDYKPVMCCDGFMCGCMGQPTNPCTCSERCETAVFDINGTMEDRRIRHGIERWQPPRRIQLRRVRGWRMPPNTVKVDRTTIYGNPYQAGEDGAGDPAYLTRLHREYLTRDIVDSVSSRARAAVELPGKNLACWCRLCEKHKDGRPYNVPCKDCSPCHADNWLNFVNPELK